MSLKQWFLKGKQSEYQALVTDLLLPLVLIVEPHILSSVAAHSMALLGSLLSANILSIYYFFTSK